MFVRANKILGSMIFAFSLMSGTAIASPVTTLTPLSSNGTDVYAVYIFGDAAHTSNLSEIGPNFISNIFCNHTNAGCIASTIGQTVYLGTPGPGIVFGLTDINTHTTFTTNALASDGYAHDRVSATVNAGNATAVAAAYSIFGQGPLAYAAAASIASLGETPGTIVTFVGWEDVVGGDYDYNDLIFAFTDPVGAVPEPLTLAIFGVGLAGLIGFRKRLLKA